MDTEMETGCRIVLAVIVVGLLLEVEAVPVAESPRRVQRFFDQYR